MASSSNCFAMRSSIKVVLDIRTGLLTLLMALCCYNVTGCAGVVARQFHPKNPTGWQFDKPIADVRLAMERAFRRQYYRKMIYLTKDFDASWTRDIFRDSLNRHDGVLLVLSQTLGKSEVYYKDGEPLEYKANFHIHVSERGAGTMVEVRAFDMQVAKGSMWTVHGYANMYMAVAPTTIDEYEIIREIGKELGVGSMPETRRPVARRVEQ